MTDGAGRISPSLALRVTQLLGLSYSPSGFQGRLGESKGFWSVDYRDESGKDWIKVYSSQRKWTRRNGKSEHSSNRTFEVLKASAPLRSADLNLQFLPILIDRSESPKAMRKAISDLLEDGLGHEIATLRMAMDSPQCFRKWIRDNNPNVKERLKANAIPYRAGLPVVIEERLNVFLDNGFDPKKLKFMKELAKNVFKNKCDDLQKRLNITVGKSTYVYMIPDFYQVLEPGEVYIDFSGFTDKISGHSEAPPSDGADVLVARSPAHYVSDIQKVKAVFKPELRGLKDVIVFSTKGNPSLAAKLSGGDYDGDIAWLCWEPTLVENFRNAEVPKCPNLVKEGFMRKDSTTYQRLVANQSNPTSTFLRAAFAFNIQQPLLGICTVYKENVCYTQGSVNSPEAVFLSTLLSSLVDQAKQGFIFTEQDWARITQDVIRFHPRVPDYKQDHLNPRSNHIVDHLMCLADKTINSALTEFHKSIPDPPQWDNDLVAYYKSSRALAERDPLWKKLLDDLDDDLKSIKAEWASRIRRDESKPDFTPFAVASHEKFLAIQPRDENPATLPLICDWMRDSELSQWALLKASALFASYHPRTHVSGAVWWVAGRQLGELKARVQGRATSVVQPMYVMLKPDSSFVRLLQREEVAMLAWENKAPPASVDELEDFDDDDD